MVPLLRFALGSALVLSPIAAAAQTDDERVVMEAIAAAGCLVNEVNGDAVLASMGMTEDQAGAIVGGLIEQGMVVVGEDGLRLLAGSCEGGGADTGMDAAIAWMGTQSDEAAAEFMADRLAAHGCQINDTEFPAFFADVARSVADRFDVALPDPVPQDTDPTFGAFIAAVDRFGDRAGGALFGEGRIESTAQGVSRLVDCAPDASAGPVVAEAGLDPATLFQRLLELGTPDVIALEARVLASIDCAVPLDMGFAVQAMMLDQVIGEAGLPLGPDLALEVMANIRLGGFYQGDYEDALNYMAGAIDQITATSLPEGRLQQNGRMMIAQDCTATGDLSALRPYLAGGT